MPIRVLHSHYRAAVLTHFPMLSRFVFQIPPCNIYESHLRVLLLNTQNIRRLKNKSDNFVRSHFVIGGSITKRLRRIKIKL